MDGLEWKTRLKWMIWGYHHLRKHPNVNQRFKGGGMIILVVATQTFFIFTPTIGEDFQFDEHIFQMGWNHQLDNFSNGDHDILGYLDVEEMGPWYFVTFDDFVYDIWWYSMIFYDIPCMSRCFTASIRIHPTV